MLLRRFAPALAAGLLFTPAFESQPAPNDSQPVNLASPLDDAVVTDNLTQTEFDIITSYDQDGVSRAVITRGSGAFIMSELFGSRRGQEDGTGVRIEFTNDIDGTVEVAGVSDGAADGIVSPETTSFSAGDWTDRATVPVVEPFSDGVIGVLTVAPVEGNADAVRATVRWNIGDAAIGNVLHLRG